MSDQTNRILNKVFKSEELIEAHTSHSENLEKNIQRSEKPRQHDADENKSSTTQQNDEIITSLNQQLRNAETTMLRLHNLQRARLLEQQAQNIAIRTQAFRNDFTESEPLEIFNLKNVGAQSTNVQSMTFENLNGTAVDALLSQIFLSFKFKIIKPEKMRTYKGQSENEHQR